VLKIHQKHGKEEYAYIGTGDAASVLYAEEKYDDKKGNYQGIKRQVQVIC
jgi:hypothetical protein